VRASGAPQDEAPDDELVALLPLLAVRSSVVGAQPAAPGEPPTTSLHAPLRLIREDNGRFRVMTTLQRARADVTRVELLAGALALDEAQVDGSAFEVELEVDVEHVRGALPSAEFV